MGTNFSIELIFFNFLKAHLIIAQMSSTKVAAITTLLIVYILIVLLSLFGLFASFEIWVLRGSAILFTLAHINYGCCVVFFF